MSLWEAGIAVLAAEESARHRVEVKVAEVTAKTVGAKRTVVRVNSNVTLPKEIVRLQGPGRLVELIIKSSSKNYIVDIEIDGEHVFNKPYDWFQEVSEVMNEISAYESDGLYYLHVTDLSFARSLVIRGLLTNTEPVTLDQVIFKAEVCV